MRISPINFFSSNVNKIKSNSEVKYNKNLQFDTVNFTSKPKTNTETAVELAKELFVNFTVNKDFDLEKHLQKTAPDLKVLSYEEDEYALDTQGNYLAYFSYDMTEDGEYVDPTLYLGKKYNSSSPFKRAMLIGHEYTHYLQRKDEEKIINSISDDKEYNTLILPFSNEYFRFLDLHLHQDFYFKNFMFTAFNREDSAIKEIKDIFNKTFDEYMEKLSSGQIESDEEFAPIIELLKTQKGRQKIKQDSTKLLKIYAGFEKEAKQTEKEFCKACIPSNSRMHFQNRIGVAFYETMEKAFSN